MCVFFLAVYACDLCTVFMCCPAGLTAAAMAEAMKLQKMKLMAMNNLHGAGSQNGTESENDELNSNTGLDLPFMMMPHPLLPVGLPPASVAMAMNQMNHLNTIANMAAAAQMHSPLSRGGASVIKECVQDSPSPAPSMEEGPRPGSQPSSHPSSSASSSPAPHQHTPDRLVMNPVDGDLGDRPAGINMKNMFKEKARSIEIAGMGSEISEREKSSARIEWRACSRARENGGEI
nr:dachshund homolog 2-like [Oncorhynchus nerka]